MKITLSSMTMIIAYLPSSRNHFLEKRKWKMKIQYVKGLLAMSLSHDILSKFYLSSWVSWIVFIPYTFRSFLLNSLPYENVIYRDQSLLYSICSSGTPYIKRVKKLFKILAVIINDILKMSAPEIIEPQWNECLCIPSIRRSDSPRDFNKLWYIYRVYSKTDFSQLLIYLIFWTTK